MAKKRGRSTASRRPRSKPKRRAGAVKTSRTRATRGKAPRTRSSRKRPSRKPVDLREHHLAVYAKQIDSLWNRLADQCRQFATGFNQAAGGSVLEIQQPNPMTIRAAYPRAEMELVLTLDKQEGYIDGVMNVGLPADGELFQVPIGVGLTVSDSTLRFVRKGDIVSDEFVAVDILTQLTSGNLERS
jgi:hypothetical protein